MTDPASNSPHLAPDVAALLKTSQESRIKAINRKMWVATLATSCLGQMAERIFSVDNGTADCLLVIGESGVGKTTIMNKMKTLYLKGRSDILYIEYDKTAFSTFAHQVCNALKLPKMKKISSTELRQILTLRGIRGIVVDDLHDVALSNKTHARSSLAIMRSLTDGPYPISIVAFGVEEVKMAMSEDAQLATRFVVKTLTRWSDNHEFKDFLAGLERLIPLSSPSRLWESSKSNYLILKGEGKSRVILRIIKQAAIYAVCEGRDSINLETLKKGATKPFEQSGWLK